MPMTQETPKATARRIVDTMYRESRISDLKKILDSEDQICATSGVQLELLKYAKEHHQIIANAMEQNQKRVQQEKKRSEQSIAQEQRQEPSARVLFGVVVPEVCSVERFKDSFSRLKNMEEKKGFGEVAFKIHQYLRSCDYDFSEQDAPRMLSHIFARLAYLSKKSPQFLEDAVLFVPSRVTTKFNLDTILDENEVV